MAKTLVLGILDSTKNTRVKNLKILLELTEEYSGKTIEDLLRKHKRISEIIFYGSKEAKIEKVIGIPIIFLHVPNLNAIDCGQICQGNFVLNIQHFTEAQNFNSCLNRKISIDANGEIKNCPSQIESFGNIKDTNLATVVLNAQFLKLWKIKKDDINVCKDCEFRYICTDCRAFLNSSNQENSKPLKCNYDPYTTTWN